jgi:hypothetical protein
MYHVNKSLGDLDDVERLLAARKPGLAFTLGAMGSRQHNFYNDAYKRAGYAAAATETAGLRNEVEPVT